jgi:hypothetical protein
LKVSGILDFKGFEVPRIRSGCQGFEISGLSVSSFRVFENQGLKSLNIPIGKFFIVSMFHINQDFEVSRNQGFRVLKFQGFEVS